MRVNLNVAQIVFCTRDYDRVLRESQTALELHPDHWAPHALVAHVYLKRGAYAWYAPDGASYEVSIDLREQMANSSSQLKNDVKVGRASRLKAK